jgi:hypothetical protein
VFLGLQVDDVNSFIYGGKCAALLYGFRESTQVNVQIVIAYEDYLEFKFINCPTNDIYVSDTPNYCLHPHKNDDVFGWQKIMKSTKLQVCVSCQVDISLFYKLSLL